jgi:hypothetical protein
MPCGPVLWQGFDCLTEIVRLQEFDLESTLIPDQKNALKPDVSLFYALARVIGVRLDKLALVLIANMS